jgi:CheY-like chemotaxis protein
MARILIIEDDAASRALLAELLEEEDHIVFECAEARSALAFAQSQKPDLILLDLGLPGMDGWELARQLKASPEFLNTPIVAVTGHVTDSQWETAQRAGCVDRVPKPVDEARLREAIHRHLPGSAENPS